MEESLIWIYPHSLPEIHPCNK